MDTGYVHGYAEPEARRLGDQADTLAELLHAGTAYPAGSRVLEAGCGVGAQTVHLVARSPGAHLTAVDVSAASLAQARKRARTVEFRQADLFDLDGEYDHVFVCFVLEHLPEPEKALAHLRTLLRPGGTITVIEGDHGSAFHHPRSEYAQAAIDCLVRLQADAGGDALIGRRLYPLLTGAGFDGVSVEPRTVYADASRPGLVTGFTRDTFTAMVEGVGETAVARGLATADGWARGVADLHRTGAGDGTFHYTFFKATGRKS
ncbi:methyltransferase domain-containing protein [Amycolatopsis balhimycina DSM 5908]|uniref:Methyltransferase domain-containing protein n=1 Tax=Amycolatopsis balhimycina DSM 5908 TaxID=1081091 RepID=A0A428WEF5_AMYBA|nr:methyltransferase [Amycolatopsis balhimycina]RSM41485.1 methyltransferase domain-containing protein [Amycolatopsis balhimycina DSM 5908]